MKAKRGNLYIREMAKMCGHSGPWTVHPNAQNAIGKVRPMIHRNHNAYEGRRS